MAYKVNQTWKDLVEPCKHPHRLTRRDFIAKGMATGFMSVALHKAVMGDLIAKAAAETNCPAPVRSLGAIGQIFSEGGPTMGARFISEAQAANINANMSKNYGITGTNLVKLGPNMVVDSTSPFGFTILQGPPGYPGGAAAWKTNVLNKISGGGHLGQFNQDDGAGQNTGLLGGVSPFKPSDMGKDLKIGASVALASWANGLPAASVSRNNLAPASFANAFSLVPAANGLTNAKALEAASEGATALQAAMAPVFNTNARKGAAALNVSANCAFAGNTALADPAYGSRLFDPAAITDLTAKVTVNSLTNPEKATLAAFYQSAKGVAGGVIMQFNGRDYHGSSPQNNIAPADIEEARAIVMFLAGCDAAQAPGAMIYFSNGQAIANGTTAVNATINGTNSNLEAPTAQGDAGGAYNAGLIIFYNPKGAPVQAKFTGTVDFKSGNAKLDPNVPSSAEAVAGLYLSAFAFINNGSIPAKALTTMQANGLARTPSKIMVV